MGQAPSSPSDTPTSGVSHPQATPSASGATEDASKDFDSQPKSNLIDKLRMKLKRTVVARRKQKDVEEGPEGSSTIAEVAARECGYMMEGDKQVTSQNLPSAQPTSGEGSVVRNNGRIVHRMQSLGGRGLSLLKGSGLRRSRDVNTDGPTIVLSQDISTENEQESRTRHSECGLSVVQNQTNELTTGPSDSLAVRYPPEYSQAELKRRSVLRLYQNDIIRAHTPPPVYSTVLWSPQRQSSISDSDGDVRNWALNLIYQENFEADLWPKSGFWESLPRWARLIGFRVERNHADIPQSASLNLPSEILLLICDHALQGAEGGDKRAQEYRKNVMSIALTCRTWAVKRHQFLFANVERSSPVEGGESSVYVSLVARFSRSWVLNNWREGSPPGWVRRYLSLYTPARNRVSEREREVELRLLANLAIIRAQHGHTRSRSIFPSCPKPLPPSSLPTIQELRLHNHHFQCFSDLMHVVWELPMLESLNCNTISWEDFQVRQPPTLRTHRTDHFEIRTHLCPDVAPFVLLATSLFKIQAEGSSGILNGFDALSLVQLTRSLIASDKGDGYIIKRDACSYKAYSSSQPQSGESKSHFTRVLEFKLQPGPESSPNTLRISNVTLTLSFYSIAARIREIQWTELGEHLSSLFWGTDKTLTILFLHDPLPEQNICSQVVVYVISQLRIMWNQGQLRFERGKGDWYGNVGEWRYVSEVEEIVLNQDVLSQLDTPPNTDSSDESVTIGRAAGDLERLAIPNNLEEIRPVLDYTGMID